MGVDGEGVETSVPQKMYHHGTVTLYFEELLEELTSFALHAFHAQWGRLQLQVAQQNLPPETVLMILDFSQNYTIQAPDEVQSAYWDAPSVTMHGIVYYYICKSPGYKKLVKHYFIQLSNDMQHDHFLPCLAVQQVIQNLENSVVETKQVVQFTDNTSAQYKCQHAFVEIACNVKPIICNFFGEKHGKSDCDAKFSSVKIAITRLINYQNAWHNPNAFLVHSAADLFQLCKMHLESQPLYETNHKGTSFQYFPKESLCRGYDPIADTIPGTKKFHSVSNMAANNGAKTELLCHFVSCACPSCICSPFKRS